MSYKKEFIASPNFTSKAYTQKAFGRPRIIKFGAGHWWGDPKAGYTHQGVINTFLNPKRQASAHAIVSANRVTEMVKDEDTAWATNNANPDVFAIEMKPDMNAADRATLVEYIADKGFHNLQWFPHNHWWSTQCNPLDWAGISRDAIAFVSQRQTPEWKKNLVPITSGILLAKNDNTPLRSFINTNAIVKTFAKGTPFEIFAQTTVGGNLYYLTKYAYDNQTGQGFLASDLELAPAPKPPNPEWITNLVDITPVKLMVLVPETGIIDLLTLNNIKNLGQGTWIDFTKQTTVQGQTYLISSYSAANSMPNGILKSAVGLPVISEPVNEKPEWLKNWEDITDVIMYTRATTDVVNLLDGSTVSVIERGKEVEISSATEWHGKKYLITKYSTEKEIPNGISIDDLDMKPIENPQVPVEPDPIQPEIEEIKKRLSAIEAFIELIKNLFKNIK